MMARGRERERERERARLLPFFWLKSTRRFPLGGALEGGPADLLFAAAGLLGGRPFERG